MTASAWVLSCCNPVWACELAAIALEIKGQRDQGQHERAAFPRHARKNRRRAGAGAAAQAGQEKNDVGPGAERADFLHVLLGRRAAQLGIAAGAQAAGAARAQDEFGRRGAGLQRLGIRIDSQEFDAVETGLEAKPAALQPAPPRPKTLRTIFFLMAGSSGFSTGCSWSLSKHFTNVFLIPPARPPTGACAFAARSRI
jgi:hypothetical protein